MNKLLLVIDVQKDFINENSKPYLCSKQIIEDITNSESGKL